MIVGTKKKEVHLHRGESTVKGKMRVNVIRRQISIVEEVQPPRYGHFPR